MCLTGGRLDLAKLLVGSEGTLGFITSATLRTVPLPGGACLTLLGFPSSSPRSEAGIELRTFEPVSCDLARSPAAALRPRPRPSVAAALVVTFEADSEREAVERAWGAIEKLRESHRLLVLGRTGVRSRRARPAFAASAKPRCPASTDSGTGPRPLAFIEDIGVPVEVLHDFVHAGARRTSDASNSARRFLIHALTGQVHTRPMVDLGSAADREKLWPLAEAVHGIALDLGGTVSTQHGTGIARTPWVEKQYGPILPVFRELKRIFDPKNLLNPGKIVGPDPSRPAWPLRTMRERVADREAAAGLE